MEYLEIGTHKVGIARVKVSEALESINDAGKRYFTCTDIESGKWCSLYCWDDPECNVKKLVGPCGRSVARPDGKVVVFHLLDEDGYILPMGQ